MQMELEGMCEGMLTHLPVDQMAAILAYDIFK